MSCSGEGKPKMNLFCDFFFFSMKYTHYLFIFLNGTIVYGVGEALIVWFVFFYIVWVFPFWKKMTKLISSWSCLIRAFNSYMLLRRGERRERKTFLSAVILGDQNQF